MMMSISKGRYNDKIIQIPEVDCTLDSRGLAFLFFTNMKKHTNKIAQISALTEEEDTFGAFRQRCIRTAIAMESRGLTSNDIISIFTTNHFDSFVPMIASLFIGAKPAPLDPSLSLDNTIQLLEQIKPKIIFVIPEAVHLVEDAIKELEIDSEIVIFGETNRHTPFSEFLQPRETEDCFEPFAVASLKETAMIFFSSGTSGLPKGACVSHYGVMKQIYNTINFGFDLDVAFLNSSIYWLIITCFYGALAITGKTRLFLPTFDAKLVWKMIPKYKPTFLFMSPYQMLEMFRVGRPDGVDTSSLKDINLGGGALLKEQILNIRKLFPGTRINLSYGMTEVHGFLACFNLNRCEDIKFAKEKPTSSGKGIPGFMYKVVDPNTEEVLGANQDGELRIKSDYLFNNYHKAAPPDVYDLNGWFITGDIAYYDEDGCIYIVDRIKEIMKVKSWHVAPKFLESVLLKHPAVKTAAVVGIPHDTDGEHPLGIVTLIENEENVTPREIEMFVENRVQDRQRLRAGVVIVDKIPTTPSGKIKKYELKKTFIKQWK